MKISGLVKNALDILQRYIWLLTVFLFIQGTAYYSTYLSQLKVDEDYYPLNLEQVLSYTMTMYLKPYSVAFIVFFFAVGLVAIFINNSFLSFLEVKLRSLKVRKKQIKTYTDKDLIQPIEVTELNKIQVYGINIVVIAYSSFVFLFAAIVPATVAAKNDAKNLIENADYQIELMKNDKSSVKSNIKIKCDSVSKSFSGPFFNIKSSTLYHSIYDGKTTITIPNSCIEFRSTNHEINLN